MKPILLRQPAEPERDYKLRTCYVQKGVYRETCGVTPPC